MLSCRNANSNGNFTYSSVRSSFYIKKEKSQYTRRDVICIRKLLCRRTIYHSSFLKSSAFVFSEIMRYSHAFLYFTSINRKSLYVIRSISEFCDDSWSGYLGSHLRISVESGWYGSKITVSGESISRLLYEASKPQKGRFPSPSSSPV